MNLQFLYHFLLTSILMGILSTGYKADDKSLTLYPPSSDKPYGEFTGIRSQACVELLTPQVVVVGEVCLSNTKDSLNVHFRVEESWYLSETHLAVASSLEGIPRVGPGIPLIGQFGYTSSHASVSTEQTYALALDSLGISPGSELVVAAHASVINDSKEEEGAWGRGNRFVKEGNPATYFSYVLDQP